MYNRMSTATSSQKSKRFSGATIVRTTGSNITQSRGMVTINGKSYRGNSVSVFNGQVKIDGKAIDDPDLPQNVLEIDVTGTLARLETDASVTCEDVKGTVIAGGSVSCDAVGGDVKASGSVSCDRVGGNVTAGGSVSHG